jgi:hypothetical protein
LDIGTSEFSLCLQSMTATASVTVAVLLSVNNLMTTTPIRLLAVPSDAIIGPHATGVIRAWVNSRGEINVVKTAKMDNAARLKAAVALMRLVESEGLSPQGVAFT